MSARTSLFTFDLSPSVSPSHPELPDDTDADAPMEDLEAETPLSHFVNGVELYGNFFPRGTVNHTRK